MPLSNSRGFTLMEIMIVVAIIAGVVAIGVPKLANQKSAMRGEVQRIAVLSRELFNAARLQKRTFRLVIEMAPNAEPKYFVESAPGQVALLTEEQKKELEAETDDREAELAELSSSKFEIDTKFVKQPESLPKGLKVDEVEYSSKRGSVKPADDETVRAMIHYFPQGFTEQALIHFTDGKTLNWTVSINPLTGKAIVIDKRLALKDIGL